MKIGILTFHTALNYGALLQTYASVRFLHSMGHDVYVLDYQNAALKRAYSLFRWDKDRWETEGLKYLLKFPLTVVSRFRRRRAFKRFIKKHIDVIPFCKASEMDAVFVGSDQVWNKMITDGTDPVYFGDAVGNVKKIAWAVSSGKTPLTSEDIEHIKSRFDAISVREKALSDIIEGSSLLPDPVMMLGASEWKQLSTPCEDKYLLAYPMMHQEEVMEKAERIAAELHLGIKVISPRIKLGSGWIQDASPELFVSLFSNASYIVTSSYHGAVFSLLFDIPHTFIQYNDPRYDTLLETDFLAAKSAAECFVKEALQ